ncbi:hypothetical protein PR048_023853 [Dryococelus australis]|uniref:Uncharacterized protein n=1 Tax=Dryococelus australis TaxID=614101 RepID=A0ABQ9GV84_9NEOP|nr:hypothetical protein PR048_023853 [Dryococelus australis]
MNVRTTTPVCTSPCKVQATVKCLVDVCRFVLLHLLSDLQRSLSQICDAAIKPWLLQQTAGPKGINVVIFDFVGSACGIASIVVNLNKKLLRADADT